MNGPWRWTHRRENNAENRASWVAEGFEDPGPGRREWLPLRDDSRERVVTYAGCGSHEVKMTPKVAAVIEAAPLLLDYVEADSIAGDVNAQRIVDGIHARQEEFERD